jgi:divalent metal cation (Fe/Co/Zn/Cd) transporter
VLLTLSLDFENSMVVGQLEVVIADLERQIRERFPLIKRIFIEAQSYKDHVEVATEQGDQI